jgi:uncharacterized protein (TIGR02594 family)
MVVEAVKLYGTIEFPGPQNNPVIMAWAAETGLDAAGYTGDDVAWCGLFMAVVAKRAGKLAPPVPLRALSWVDFGNPSPEPSLGDVLVFERKGGGHVALYVGEDDDRFYCLGGNQSDAVTIAPKERSRLKTCRRPIYRTKPGEVRPVRIGLGAIASAGATSEV